MFKFKVGDNVTIDRSLIRWDEVTTGEVKERTRNENKGINVYLVRLNSDKSLVKCPEDKLTLVEDIQEEVQEEKSITITASEYRRITTEEIDIASIVMSHCKDNPLMSVMLIPIVTEIVIAIYAKLFYENDEND